MVTRQHMTAFEYIYMEARAALEMKMKQTEDSLLLAPIADVPASISHCLIQMCENNL